MDNNQIFRNWFVIIHRHLTKVSAQIIQCIIFERNELSLTISTLCFHLVYYFIAVVPSRLESQFYWFSWSKTDCRCSKY